MSEEITITHDDMTSLKPETNTAKRRRRKSKPTPKPDNLVLVLWRSRQRGYLAVIAHDLEEARVVAVQKQTNLQNFVTRTPEAILPVEAGQVAYIKQRL